ncbi:MAG: phospholipase D-like domain-containing protein [Parvibaculum sp.]|uniref:phospholipase D-like domain-containing protein n=1 Tax=Parvibaculum sp. TaxID=2024848 RepID=UPI002730FE27|nr:phospholipase D-like domain-containing protein [Parvibaculum sp.]MDP2149255.1 phospholipase D-like domain-containing protein [Parvibaculum sp.]
MLSSLSWPEPPPRRRGFLHRCRSLVLVASCLVSTVGCASLPEPAHEQPDLDLQPVQLESGRGTVSVPESAAIIRRLERQAGQADAGGDGGILQRHLAVEEAINTQSPLVLGNQLRLLKDGPATYEAMFAAMRTAKDHIHLQTYIFADDAVGRQFADLLLEKQAAGVQVNLIYDSVGCLDTPASFFQRLRDGGVAVLEFNPINPLMVRKDEWLLNNRDHRKLLVVDGRTAFLGGININESYSSGSSAVLPGRSDPHDPSEAGWRDTHLQIDGPVVAEFQKLFFDTWTRQKGPPLAQRNYFPPLTPQGDHIVRAIGSTADDEESLIYSTLLSAIDHAEQRVFLTNAYFVPDPRLMQSLTTAARRGVDVRLILPSQTDSWAVFHAGRSHYAALLRAGVKVFERRGTVLHSKTATVDGVWSTIGSTNLDWRSFLHNDELNAVVLGHGFSRQMEAMFEYDQKQSDAIDLKRWNRRSPLLRIKEWAARLAEYWL